MSRHVDALIEFVNRDLLEGRSRAVDGETPLFEDGLIDSLNILRLIAFVETRRGREVPDREIVMSRFRNLKTIAESFLE
jgi:2-hydroxymuconate-semialdehyde hydrolase